MPWAIHIDPAVNCAFVKFYGDFELEQMVRAAGDVFNHPDFRDGMNILRDARKQRISQDVSFKSLAKEARQLMDKFHHTHGNCKSAVVAGDVQSYAKFHQYIVAGRLADTPIERKVFRDMEKAKEWLGLPQGYEIRNPAPDEEI